MNPDIYSATQIISALESKIRNALAAIDAGDQSGAPAEAILADVTEALR